MRRSDSASSPSVEPEPSVAANYADATRRKRRGDVVSSDPQPGSRSSAASLSTTAEVAHPAPVFLPRFLGGLGCFRRSGGQSARPRPGEESLSPLYGPPHLSLTRDREIRLGGYHGRILGDLSRYDPGVTRGNSQDGPRTCANYRESCQGAFGSWGVLRSQTARPLRHAVTFIES